jgi:hypothetical protein
VSMDHQSSANHDQKQGWKPHLFQALNCSSIQPGKTPRDGAKNQQANAQSSDHEQASIF